MCPPNDFLNQENHKGFRTGFWLHQYKVGIYVARLQCYTRFKSYKDSYSCCQLELSNKSAPFALEKLTKTIEIVYFSFLTLHRQHPLKKKEVLEIQKWTDCLVINFCGNLRGSRIILTSLRYGNDSRNLAKQNLLFNNQQTGNSA